jgi:hypothetical protein
VHIAEFGETLFTRAGSFSTTIVREYVARAMLRAREMFVPLSHRPGHAQADCRNGSLPKRTLP